MYKVLAWDDLWTLDTGAGSVPRASPASGSALMGTHSRSGRAHVASWCATTNTILAESSYFLSTPFPQSIRQCGPPDLTYLDSARYASLFARRVALARWQLAANPSATGEGVCAVPPCPHNQAVRPPVRRLGEVLSFLYGDFLQPRGDALDWPVVSPLSIPGPGCSGGLISLVSRHLPEDYFQAIQNIKHGRKGLFMVPLVPKNLRFYKPKPLQRMVGRRGSSSAMNAPAAQQPPPPPDFSHGAWARLAHGIQPCPLCYCSPSTPFDSFHVLVECTHASVVAARRIATRYLPQLLHRVASDCARARVAMEKVVRETYSPLNGSASGSVPAAALVRQAAQCACDAGWASPENRFSLFRLLCVSPWSTWHLAQVSVASFTPSGTPVSDTLSGMLATTFDYTRTHHCYLRRLAHAWARWAGSSILTICKSWSLAFSASPFFQTLS